MRLGSAVEFGVASLMCAFISFSVFHACTACAEPAKHPAYCTDEIAFTARLVACVEGASSREESRACRGAVHERCGITMAVADASVAP